MAAHKDVVSHSEAQGEVFRLLADPQLSLSPRGRSLLAYVVEAKLRGETQVDPRAIAQQVLGRPVGFAPSDDAIVRTEMTRVRTALQRYYDARKTMVRITIPLRSHLPVFERTEPGLNEQPLGPSDPLYAQPLARPAEPARGLKFERLEFYVVTSGAILVIVAGSLMALGSLL